MARLKEKYKAEIAPALMKQFGYKSVMQIPKIDKVVVNVGCGEARENSKVLENVVGDLSKITGQKPIITKAPMIFVMLSISVASAKRITEVLNEEVDLVNPTNPIMNVPNGSIVFDHV